MSDLIIYNTPDGKSSIALYDKDGSVWLNQTQIAELFATSKQNIGQHVASILKESELDADSVVKNYFTTAADGKNYYVTFYSLEMIMAIGFRVRGVRGTQFRQWANRNLTEDVIDTLNRLVVIFLETAELTVKERKDLTMSFWKENVDRLLNFQNKKILQGSGTVSNAQMESHVVKLYEQFDQKRKAYEAKNAGKNDLEEIKAIESKLKKRNERSGNQSGIN